MTHPDWALKHKQKNTEIRHIKGRYYLYKITSRWDPQKKRTKKVTLAMVGIITEKDGLIPKGTVPRGRPKKQLPPAHCPALSVVTKEYGASSFLSSIAPDIQAKLKDLFPSQWQTIFTLAILRLLYQAPLKKCAFLAQESFLCETLPGVTLGKDFLTGFMHRLGTQRETIVHFMKDFIQGAEQIVFDATSMVSHAKESKLAARGYKRAQLLPALSRKYPGYQCLRALP